MLENKIILRSVYKFTRCHMEPAKIPATGRYADSVRNIDSNNDPILSDEDKKTNRFYIKLDDVIEIFDGKEFNLDDEQDNAWWEAIRFSKKIAQDRWERNKAGELVVDGNSKRYGNAEFYVERPGLESKIKNTRKREIHEAKSYIYKDSVEGLLQKARLLGNSMNGLPSSDVEDYLISLAEKTPVLITELYTGSDTHLRLFLLDGIDKDVIYKNDNLYYYGDNIVLGATDTAAIQYFKNPDNKRITDMIKREVYPDYFTPEVVTADKVTDADLKKTTSKK